MTRIVKLDNGDEVHDVPDDVADSQVKLRFAGSVMSGDKPVTSTLEDIRHGIVGAVRNAGVSTLTTPAKAVIGGASMLNDAVGGGADFTGVKKSLDTIDSNLRQAPTTDLMGTGSHAGATAGGLKENLSGPLKDLPSDANYQPQTAVGKLVSAVAGGATSGAMMASPGKVLSNAAVGGISSAAGQTAATNGLGPEESAIAAAAPNLLLAGKSVALPNRAIQSVQRASTPQELAAALALMKQRSSGPTAVPVSGSPNGPEQPLQVPNIPILPGQAFGPNHQMAGIQESLIGNPKVGAELQTQLRAQQGQMDAATAQDAPYRQMFNDAGTTKVSQAGANNLALALSRAGRTGNPIGPDLGAVGDLASMAIKTNPNSTFKYQPVSNLGEVQSLRDQINAAPIPTPSAKAMKDTVNEFLRTRDGRFAAADTAHEQLMTNKAEVETGISNMGAPALATAGSGADPAVAATRVANLGTLGLAAPIASAIKNRQAEALAKVFTDTTGQRLLEASKYSPAGNATDQLVRALMQASQQDERN